MTELISPNQLISYRLFVPENDAFMPALGVLDHAQESLRSQPTVFGNVCSTFPRECRGARPASSADRAHLYNKPKASLSTCCASPDGDGSMASRLCLPRDESGSRGTDRQ